MQPLDDLAREEWVLDLQREYEKTRDVRYAALALGASPDEPPDWALSACIHFFDDHEVSAQRFDDTPARGGLKNPRNDGATLQKAAEGVARGMTISRALKDLMNADSDDTDLRRLLRVWKKRSDPLFEYEGKPIDTNRWLKNLSIRGWRMNVPTRRTYKKRNEPLSNRSMTGSLKPVIAVRTTSPDNSTISNGGNGIEQHSPPKTRKPQDRQTGRKR